MRGCVDSVTLPYLIICGIIVSIHCAAIEIAGLRNGIKLDWNM